MPAGPINGRPDLSSFAPGASPMKIILEFIEPSPGTVLVLFNDSVQLVQLEINSTIDS